MMIIIIIIIIIIITLIYNRALAEEEGLEVANALPENTLEEEL